MNKLEKSLALLKKLVQETPKDVLEKHFEKYEQVAYEGATVEAYFSNFATNHNFLPSFFDLQEDNTKNRGVSVFFEQRQETVSTLPIESKVKIKQEVSFACKTGENSYANAA